MRLFDALNHPALSPQLRNELKAALQLQGAATVERLLRLAFTAAKDMEQRRTDHPHMKEPPLPTAQLLAAWSHPVRGEGAHIAAKYVHLYVPASLAFALLAARGITTAGSGEHCPADTTGFYKPRLLRRGASGRYAHRLERATFRRACATLRATNDLILTGLPQESWDCTSYLYQLLSKGLVNRGALPLLSSYRFFAVKVELLTLLPSEDVTPTPDSFASLVRTERPRGALPLKVSVETAVSPRLVSRQDVMELRRWLLMYHYLAVPWNNYVLKGMEALRTWLNCGRPHTMNKGLEQQAYESSKDTGAGQPSSSKRKDRKAQKKGGEQSDA